MLAALALVAEPFYLLPRMSWFERHTLLGEVAAFALDVWLSALANRIYERLTV